MTSFNYRLNVHERKINQYYYYYYYYCKSNYFVHEKMYDCEVLYQPVHLGGQSYIRVLMFSAMTLQ